MTDQLRPEDRSNSKGHPEPFLFCVLVLLIICKLASFECCQVGGRPALPLSPATKVAFALPHHPTQENLPHHPTQEKRKKVDRKINRKRENEEDKKGELEREEKGNCKKLASERGEEVRVKENLSSSESSTFSDGEEDNPPFIRWDIFLLQIC